MQQAWHENRDNFVTVIQTIEVQVSDTVPPLSEMERRGGGVLPNECILAAAFENRNKRSESQNDFSPFPFPINKQSNLQNQVIYTRWFTPHVHRQWFRAVIDQKSPPPTLLFSALWLKTFHLFQQLATCVVPTSVMVYIQGILTNDLYESSCFTQLVFYLPLLAPSVTRWSGMYQPIKCGQVELLRCDVYRLDLVYLNSF